MGALKPNEWEYNWEDFRKSLELLKKSIELVENNKYMEDDLLCLLIDGVLKRFKDTYEHALDVLGAYVSSINDERVLGPQHIIFYAMKYKIIKEWGWMNIVEFVFDVMGEHDNSEKKEIYKSIGKVYCRIFTQLDKRLFEKSSMLD